MKALGAAGTQNDREKCRIYEEILVENPTDVFALQMMYFNHIYNGRTAPIR